MQPRWMTFSTRQGLRMLPGGLPFGHASIICVRRCNEGITAVGVLLNQTQLVAGSSLRGNRSLGVSPDLTAEIRVTIDQARDGIPTPADQPWFCEPEKDQVLLCGWYVVNR